MTSQVIKTRNVSQLDSGTLRGLLLLVGLIALLGFIYLGQNGQATMTGRRALDLQEQLDRIKRENAQLEVEIAQLTLPSRIVDRGKALGFRPATFTQTVFVVVKNYPVESKPAAAPAAAAASSSSDPAVWLNDLLAQVGLAPTARTVEATGP